MSNSRTSINNQQNYDHQKNNHNYNNNNYHTAPGVCIISPEDGERICRAYTENVGTMTSAVAGIITAAVKDGLTVDNIIMAINETGLAPRPTAYYLRAILRNWCQYGVTTSRIRHEAAADKPSPWYKQNPALNYQQRQYTDADFSGDDFIEEAKRYIEQR